MTATLDAGGNTITAAITGLSGTTVFARKTPTTPEAVIGREGFCCASSAGT